MPWCKSLSYNYPGFIVDRKLDPNACRCKSRDLSPVDELKALDPASPLSFGALGQDRSFPSKVLRRFHHPETVLAPLLCTFEGASRIQLYFWACHDPIQYEAYDKGTRRETLRKQPHGLLEAEVMAWRPRASARSGSAVQGILDRSEVAWEC